MKSNNYSIRLTEEMTEHIKTQAKLYGLLPSEYLRDLILKDMRGIKYGDITKTTKK